MKEDEQGWGKVPPLSAWRCPECGEWSPAADWLEAEFYCEDCGGHDGRECPRCRAEFDYVWDDERIAKASEGEADHGPVSASGGTR